MYSKEKWTRSSVKGAEWNEKLGGYIARKTSRAGATESVLLNHKTMQPKVFKNPDDALKANADRNHIWYH